MAVLNILWAHWTSETRQFSLLWRCLLRQCRLNLLSTALVYSTESCFFQAGAASSCAFPCSVQCSSPAGAPRFCGPRDNFGIVTSGGNSFSSLSKTSVGGVTSVFLLPGDRGFSSVQGWPHVSPPNRMTGWWWLANPPEKILLDSKLHLCCSLAALRGKINGCSVVVWRRTCSSLPPLPFYFLSLFPFPGQPNSFWLVSRREIKIKSRVSIQ